jgi:predicted RNase H-like HicB family nuclease
MATASYTAVFEQAGDGTWGGHFPDLPTILVNGATLEEARENAKTGLEFWLESMHEEGLPVPQPSAQAMAYEVDIAA